MTHDWQNDPRVLEALFRHLMARPRLIPQPDRRSGLDRRRAVRGGRRSDDPREPPRSFEALPGGRDPQSSM